MALVTESTPTHVGDYRILNKLGEGGMAEVFVAVQEGSVSSGKQVVLKRMHRRFSGIDRARRMFFREARLAARLRHTNVVQVFDLLEQDGEPWIVMEHLEGLSWREVARRSWGAGRSLPLAAVVRGCADAALGLHHAHGLTGEGGQPTPLIHRDISPDNLFLVRDGTTKVLDFGIAKASDTENLTQTAEVKGKLPFMSPEQIKGEEMGPASDMWALGVSLFWLTTGSRPFQSSTDALLGWAILRDDPAEVRDLNAHVPPGLVDIIRSLLNKDVGMRPASGLDVFESLTRLFPEDARNRSGVELIARASALADPARGDVVVPSPAALPPSTAWEPTSVGSHAETAPATVESAPPSALVQALTVPGTPALPNATTAEAPTQISAPARSELPETQPSRPPAQATTVSLADAATMRSEPRELPDEDTVLRPVAQASAVEADTDLALTPRFDSLSGDDPSTVRAAAPPSPIRNRAAAAGITAFVLVTAALAFVVLGADEQPSLPTGAAPAFVPEAPKQAPAETAPEVPAAPPKETLPEAPPRGPLELPPNASPNAPPNAPPNTPPTASPNTAPDRPNEKAAAPRLAVRVKASARVRWYVSGRRSALPVSGGVVRLSRRVAALTALDPATGGRTRVPIVEGTADLDKVENGSLDIVVLPWAEVSIGKRSLGRTPLDPVPLRAGRYAVKLRWKEVERVVRVDVPPGGVGRVRADLRR